MPLSMPLPLPMPMPLPPTPLLLLPVDSLEEGRPFCAAAAAAAAAAEAAAATAAAESAEAAVAWEESERVRRLDQARALAYAGNVELGMGLSSVGEGGQGGLLFLGPGSGSADSLSLGMFGQSGDGGEGGSAGGDGVSLTRSRRKVW